MSNPVATYTLGGSNHSVTFDAVKYESLKVEWPQDLVESTNPVTRAKQRIHRGVYFRATISFDKMMHEDAFAYVDLLNNGTTSVVFYPSGSGQGFNCDVTSNLGYAEEWPDIVSGVSFVFDGIDLLAAPVDY